MNIVLIGAGNLATNLGMAMAKAGHNIMQVYSRTIESAQRLADMLHTDATNDLDNVKDNADVYIISVKDSVMSGIIEKLCPGNNRPLFLHTAGSMPMDMFCGKAERYGVLYPMQTFSKDRIVDFGNIPIFIEGSDSATTNTILQLANSLSSNVRELSSEARKHLHLAAVFACNFANHCYALSAEILERNGLPFDVILPLIDETAGKVHMMHPAKAQTGPAIRYDENVIGGHLNLLDYNPAAKDIYEKMSISIHNKSKEQ